MCSSAYIFLLQGMSTFIIKTENCYNSNIVPHTILLLNPTFVIVPLIDVSQTITVRPILRPI